MGERLMALNVGYLTSDTSPKGDEVYTPFYAVEPLIKYLNPEWTIWLPFDEEWSAFYQLLTEKGFKVRRTSLVDGQDFFEYTPDFEYDVIVSNPPFSKKDKILKRLQELNKPFAILLPIQTLQGQGRFKYLNGIQLLSFDKRIGYHTNQNFKKTAEGNHFASAFFCKNILPRDLILEELVKYQRPLRGQ